MTEVSMWLYPVALAALIGLVLSARFGLRWTWGICLQQVIILIFAGLGFIALYAPIETPPAVHKETLAAFCAIAAWLLFLGYNIGQRVVLNHFSLDLSMFRVQHALSRCWLVRMLTWGPPGKYWCDMAYALQHYNNNDPAAADAILRKWEQDPRMPGPAKESLVGFFMLGRVLLHDWEGIVRQFEQNQKALSTSRTFVPYQMASRAYAELGRFAEAAECLEKANMQPTKTTPTNLDINFMTLFSLFGALDQLKEVFNKCGDFRAMPRYVRDYWLGRCHAIRGESETAVEILSRCKNETPKEMETWHRRIDSQLARASDQTEHPFEGAPAEVVQRSEQLYSRLRHTVDVLRPTAARPGVIWLMVSLLAAFAITNADPTFHRYSYTIGELTAPGLLRGQWWRAVTYLFLHGNTAHLLLNAFALFLFGKSVENTYGTLRLLVIFFGAGVLSGIFQIALVPQDSAIGASGAILGVFGAAIAGIIKLKNVLPANVRKAELKWMISIAIAQVVFDQLVNGVAALTDKSPGGVRIAAFAHVGGIVAGFVIGMILRTKQIKNVRP